jgi:hypothetical protein
MRLFHPLRISVVSLALLAPAASFANDNFAAAIAVAIPSTTNSSNTTATIETGEVSACGGGKSIWYKITPGSSGMIGLDTNGSSFDTELAVYTGATLATLEELTCNDDYVGLQARVTFAAQAGVTYYIRFSGFGSSSGSTRLNVSTQPAALFTQCPVVGAPGGCQYLLTAEADGDVTVQYDSNQPQLGPHRGSLVGVQNDTGAPLCNVGVVRPNAFGFGDLTNGICHVDRQPVGCPFGDTLYEGPDVTFDSPDVDFATVTFDPCIPDGDSGYFSTEGFRSTTAPVACNADDVCDGSETCTNCPMDCGECDLDMDGEPDDSDNCPSLANPNQADLDADTQGNVCDSMDNTLQIASVTVKLKPTSVLAIVKGSLTEPTPLHDVPDASAGGTVQINDQFETDLMGAFLGAECKTTTGAIRCKSADKLALYKVKLSKADEGIVPFMIKLKSLTPVTGFAGPVEVRINDQATSVDRYNYIENCLVTETKLTCEAL